MAKHKAKPFVPAPSQRSCGKNRYNTKQEAEAVAIEQEIRFSSQGLKLKVYHCSFCGGWHLTKHTEPWL